MLPAADDRFARFYDEQIWRVYGFFGYRLASREQAEDLTQVTFERALRAWRRFDERRASEATWVMTIARNLLIDHFRRPSPVREPLDEDLLDPALVDTGREEGSLGLSPELESALGKLGQREREILALRYGADLTGPEIAALTELSVDTVHQILSRSLRRLRRELEPQGSSLRAAPALD